MSQRWAKLVGIAFAANVVAVVIVAVVLTNQATTNRSLIHDLGRDKASIAQLQSTNCKLRRFALAAARARAVAATHDPSPAERKADLQAAKEYHDLAQSAGNTSCSG